MEVVLRTLEFTFESDESVGSDHGIFAVFFAVFLSVFLCVFKYGVSFEPSKNVDVSSIDGEST